MARYTFSHSEFYHNDVLFSYRFVRLGLKGIYPDGMRWEATGGSVHSGIRLVDAHFLETREFAVCQGAWGYVLLR